MGKIKDVLQKFNKARFIRYFIFSIIFLLILVLIGDSDLTHSRYETDTNLKLTPNLAFFLVDVTSESGQIQLDGILPSDDPYIYRFNVSNYYKTQKANVDLKYTMEIITTTNIPLSFKVYRGNDLTTNMITEDYYETDSNGVYYRHLKIDGTYYFEYSKKTTDVYTLYVTFPKDYKAYADEYAGVIDAIEIKINAEQVI